MIMQRSLALAIAFAGLLLRPASVSAFPHTLAPGETLASLSRRYYGTPQLERVLVTANGLDRGGPRTLAPGMILEVPTHNYVRVREGDTWQTLAQAHLGHPGRATTLAHQNDSEPWLVPEMGRVIRLPYNLAWVLSGEESLTTLAYRFLGTTKRAYELAEYNQLKDAKLKAGQVLLIPLHDLSLTEEGVAEASSACGSASGRPQGDEDTLRAQSQAQAELSELYSNVRAGRYVQALSQAVDLRARGELTRPRQVELLRLELEIHVAFETHGPARAACQGLRELAPDFRFDPIETSPKVLAACPTSPETKAP